VAAGVQLKPIAGGFPGLSGRAPRIVVAALNRVATSTRTAAVRAISADLGAKQGMIRDALVVNRANRSNMEAELVAKGQRIPISELGARETQRGVTYRARGRRALIPGAFIARLFSGTAGVAKRRGKRRLPIAELFGPSIPLVFVHPKAQAAVRETILKRVSIEMETSARFFGQAAGGGE